MQHAFIYYATVMSLFLAIGLMLAELFHHRKMQYFT